MRAHKSKAKKKPADLEAEIERFREMARQLGADESPDALDKAFGRIDPKKQPKKPKAER